MRDVFYTILVVWIVWRILNSINVYKTKHTGNSQQTTRKEGETTVDYIPPTKKKISDEEGDYVDYEEMK
jgi:hypothetical protein